MRQKKTPPWFTIATKKKLFESHLPTRLVKFVIFRLFDKFCLLQIFSYQKDDKKITMSNCSQNASEFSMVEFAEFLLKIVHLYWMNFVTWCDNFQSHRDNKRVTLAPWDASISFSLFFQLKKGSKSTTSNYTHIES